MGNRWYLVFSTFSARCVTRYRMSASLAGPWTAPENDALDGRAFYAAKTCSDGARRFAIGWIATREGESDAGAWQWGGAVAAHELERPIELPPGEVVALSVLVDGSAAVAYAGDRVAMSFRMYGRRVGRWGLFVTDGNVRFERPRLLAEGGPAGG